MPSYNCKQLPVHQLETICRCGLGADNTQQPVVLDVEMHGKHYWYNAEEHLPAGHGPFDTRKLALVNAIETEGIVDPESWGLTLVGESATIH